MKKVINPFNRGSNSCFGCSSENLSGLKLEFHDNGKEIYCEWEPQPQFQGFNDVLHGGIQATLLDEIASWTVFTKARTAGVTSRMNLEYLRPVFISKGKITLRSEIMRTEDNYCHIRTRLFNSKGDHCTTAEVVYYLYPLEIARKRLFYPGVEEFYEK